MQPNIDLSIFERKRPIYPKSTLTFQCKIFSFPDPTAVGVFVKSKIFNFDPSIFD